jgi:DeoR/GlpR family transcriptional regulator of sugar metabolism
MHFHALTRISMQNEKGAPMPTINLPQERKQAILEELRLHGRVVAAELCNLYGVSEDTIRRDLRELAAAGLLKRVHGGALPISPNNIPFMEGDKQNPINKVMLARTARELVQDGQLILLGGGTTNTCIAKNLPPDLRATIVTISPQIALHLASYQHIDVILIGGHLNKKELVASDAEAVAQIKRFQADICFLGVCGLHPEVGCTIFDYEEVNIMRTFIEQSGDIIATVTAEKLGTVGPYIVSPISAISHIITEKQVEDEILAPYSALGIQVFKAD